MIPPTHCFKLTKILLLALLVQLTLISCWKQKPSITTNHTTSPCAKVNYTKGFMLHNNMLNLFKCSGWKGTYPHLYDTINKIAPTSWNHIIGNFGEFLLDNRERRDNFFKIIRELDASNGLIDLEYIVSSFLDAKLLTIFNRLLPCIEDDATPFCTSTQDFKLTKDEFKSLVQSTNIGRESINDFLNLFRALTEALAKDETGYKKEINLFLTTDLFKEIFTIYLNSFAQKVTRGLSKKDVSFLRKIFSTTTLSSDNPFLFTWIMNEELTPGIFNDFIQYPYRTEPLFIQNIKAFQQTSMAGITCNPLTQSTHLSIDLNGALNQFLDYVVENNYDDFFLNSLQNTNLLMASSPFCPEITSYNSYIEYLYFDKQNREIQKLETSYRLNPVQFMSKLPPFLVNVHHFDFFRFLIYISTSEKAGSTKSSSYFTDLLSDDIFSNSIVLNEIITYYSKDFNKTILSFLKSLDLTAYISAGNIASLLTEKRFNKPLKAIAKMWLSFERKEKYALLNFLEQHFKTNIKLTSLSQMYNGLLTNLIDLPKFIYQRWAVTDSLNEKTIRSLKDITSNLSKEGVVNDLKLFLSRKNMLSIVKTISNGIAVSPAITPQTTQNQPHYQYHLPFSIFYQPSSISNDIIACISSIIDQKDSFYTSLSSLSSICRNIQPDNLSLRFLKWMNSFSSDYNNFLKTSFAFPIRNGDTILSATGIISPDNLNFGLGVFKIIDIELSPSQVSNKDGLKSLLESIRYHLFELNNDPSSYGFLLELSKLTQFVGSSLHLNNPAQADHRNFIIKNILSDTPLARTTVDRFSEVLFDYGYWVEHNKTAYINSMFKENMRYDDTFSCKNQLNQNLGTTECPEKSTIKKIGKLIVNLLIIRNEESMPSVLDLVLQAFIPGKGLPLPSNNTYDKHKRFSLKEAANLFYQFSDKSLPINNKEINYIKVDESYGYHLPLFKEESRLSSNNHDKEDEVSGKTIERTTTLERFEILARDTRFDKNYLGTRFINSIAKSRNYSRTVEKMSKWFKVCAFMRFCGKPINRRDKKLITNVLSVYPALGDLNKEPFRFGDLIQLFFKTLVLSSTKTKHKSHLLTRLTQLSTFSNIGRILRDRVGRNRIDFSQFMNSFEFNIVDKALATNLPLNDSREILYQLIGKTISMGKNGTLFEQAIDWMYSLDYQQLRLVENSVSNFLVIVSYLGTPSILFPQNTINKNLPLIERYRDNNLLEIISFLNEIIDYWPQLKILLDKNGTPLIEIFKPANNLLHFFRTKITQEKNMEINNYYILLNEFYITFKKILFLPDPKNNKGIDFLKTGLGNETLRQDGYNAINGVYKYLSSLHNHPLTNNFFSPFAKNISQIYSSNKVNWSVLKKYLTLTTQPENFNYDEPARIIKYLSKKDSIQDKTPLEKVLTTVLKDEMLNIYEIIDATLPHLIITKIPYQNVSLL